MEKRVSVVISHRAYPRNKQVLVIARNVLLKRSIIEGVRFDYLLVDSWFTCTELLKFVFSRHFGCHLIGMIKMGKTKYETALGNKTAPFAIISC